LPPSSARATAAAAAILLFAAVGAASDDAALTEKAAAFRSALFERHLSREGIVLYRVDLTTLADDLERGTYPNLADAPVFTGAFAAASCRRASVEDDPSEALRDARLALGGLAFLMQVTGQPGLMARSVRRDAGRDIEGQSGKWLRGAAPHDDYVYRADVSADQYASGLLPAVAACAAQNPERTRELITAFAAHLLEHDMQLVDSDGERTRFGDLSWHSGLGFNSIYQLAGYAAFVLAAALDPDPRWAEQRDRLRDHYKLPARTRTTNLRLGALTNHSNDLMIWNLYLALAPTLRRSGDPALADLRQGMFRAWLRVRDDQNAYFAAAFCSLEPASCDRESLAQARDLLTRFPLEKRKLEPAAALDDLPQRWLPDRKGKPLAKEVVPIELRPVSSFEWKSSPYRLTGGTKPSAEYTGVDFLAAYWLLREAEASLAASE
jgi:hypothetical protein